MIKIHLSKILGEKRMTQKELAERTEIRPATIHEMYHELIDRVNLEHLSSICRVLNIQVEDILEYIPDKKNKF
ncbi:helix-turn-helix domain-containing protein [Filifactor alocis]|uniref:helix-turn-helix domain-containing protein n=1 Tax=Filifactor alocis TaxID=143361 RepID=UPI003C6ED50B